jgi:hypothetical protein
MPSRLPKRYLALAFAACLLALAAMDLCLAPAGASRAALHAANSRIPSAPASGAARLAASLAAPAAPAARFTLAE